MRRLLVAVLLITGLAGCTTAAAASPPPVCESWAAVKNTVDHIRDVNVSENGLSALRPYLTQLRDELNQLVIDAQAQFGAQADPLKAAVEQLGADLQARNLPAVRTSVAAVRSAADNLHNALLSTC